MSETKQSEVTAGSPSPERLGSLDGEPNVVRATVRDADDELHIECRFSDGQKFAVVRVDADFPALAQKIAKFLSANTVIVKNDN